MASMEGKQSVGGYTLFRNRDSLASILCNSNTFILTDTHTHTLKTLASFYLEIQKYIKSETMEHEQSETIDKGKKKLRTMICVGCFLLEKLTNKQTIDTSVV